MSRASSVRKFFACWAGPRPNSIVADRDAGAAIELGDLGRARSRGIGSSASVRKKITSGRIAMAARSAGKRSVPPSAVMPPTKLAGQLLVAIGGERDPPPAAAQVEVPQLLVEEDDVKLMDARRAIRGFG